MNQKKFFADFEFDTVTGELRRGGELVRLQSQPAQVLIRRENPLYVGEWGQWIDEPGDSRPVARPHRRQEVEKTI